MTDGESDEKVEDEVGKKTDLYKTDPQNTFVHLSAMPKLSAQNCNIFFREMHNAKANLHYGRMNSA